MNRVFILLPLLMLNVLIGSSASAKTSPKKLPFADGDRILFIGDSITQDGRYVDLVRGYLWARYPELELTVINAGLSSETVSGITEPVHPYPRPNINDRLDRAIKLAAPDWVFVCYGMNDGIYHPVEIRITTAFRDGLKKVIDKLNIAGARIVLLTPPVFDAQAPLIRRRIEEAKPDEPYGYLKPFQEYDQTLAALSKMVKYFLVTEPLTVIDLHMDTQQFLAAAKRADPEFEYGDGVHPPLAGHAAMARSILVGLDESPATVDQTLALIADVRPPGTDANQLPASPVAVELREALFARGRTLSAQVRSTVDPIQGPATVDRLPASATDRDTAKIKTMIGKAMSN